MKREFYSEAGFRIENYAKIVRKTVTLLTKQLGIKMWGNSRAKLDYAALVCKPYLVVDSKKERSSKTKWIFF